MKRITSNIVNEARSMLQYWKQAGKDTHSSPDPDFQMRQLADIFGVDHFLLEKALKDKKERRKRRKRSMSQKHV